jgi:hypothetical protein
MDESDYAFEAETHAVIGAALEVLSQLGHGIHEKPYENALVIELGLREICCRQQTRFDVICKTVKVAGLPLGLIFNFRYAKLQWERLALTR